MASIRKRNNKWQVQVRRKNYPLITQTFQSKQLALRWARKEESNFKSTDDERLNYKVISELKDNTYLIETDWPWLWGHNRYGYFVINLDKEYLRLVDNYIIESISPPINSYKINDDRVLIEIDNKKISLLFNNT